MAFRPVIPGGPRYVQPKGLDFSPLERGIDSGIRRNALLEQRKIEEEVRAQQEALQRDQMAATASHRNAMLGLDRERMKMAQANADRSFGLQAQQFKLRQSEAERELAMRTQKQEMINRMLFGGGGQPAGTLTGDERAGPIAQPQIPQAQPGLNLSQQGRQAAVLDYALTGGKNVANIIQNDSTKSLTPAQKAIDTSFGKDYADFVRDGAQTIEKNLDQLQYALKEMRAGGVSGFVPGLAARNPMLGAQINPRAVEVKNAIDEVVQQNLRAILGGQFAQQESKELIERAYQPFGSEEDNIRRVARLERAIRKGYEQKKRMAQYFEQNGTLRGFKGTIPTHDTIAKDAGLEKSNNVNKKGQQNKQQPITYTAPDGRNFIKKDGKWFEQ